ncbi:MAG TPA: hypothetical protein VN577_07280 [Terriglobales bacterium]|nr:hypothetical protein [Terriglobales bacterium]
MFRRLASILIALIILSPFLIAEEAALPDAPSATQAKVKGDLAKFATEQKKVTVNLNDTSKVTGKVQNVGEENFVILDSKTGQASTINFTDVAGVKKSGMSKATKVLLGVGIAVGASFAIVGIQCATGSISC